MFPKGHDRALRIQNAFDLLDIMEGKVTKLSLGDAADVFWKKMDSQAQSFMIRHEEKITDHRTSFQEAVLYVANTEFAIPKSTTVAILLLTLLSDPKNPKSWDHSVS